MQAELEYHRRRPVVTETASRRPDKAPDRPATFHNGLAMVLGLIWLPFLMAGFGLIGYWIWTHASRSTPPRALHAAPVMASAASIPRRPASQGLLPRRPSTLPLRNALAPVAVTTVPVAPVAVVPKSKLRLLKDPVVASQPALPFATCVQTFLAGTLMLGHNILVTPRDQKLAHGYCLMQQAQAAKQEKAYVR